MNIHYHESFKNDLSKIIAQSSSEGEYFKNFGAEVAKLIIEEVQEICQSIESLTNSSNFSEKIKENFRCAKLPPRVYTDNGFNNCDGLFFQVKSSIKGGITWISFYLPFIFDTSKQYEEMCKFTKDGKKKSSDMSNIKFYSVVYFTNQIIY